MVTLPPDTLKRLIKVGLSPDMFELTAAVLLHLPKEITSQDLAGFLVRNAVPLSSELWWAWRDLGRPYDTHPADGYPPRRGPVRREMSMAEVETIIRLEPFEYAVLFDGSGRQVARFGPNGTRAAGEDPRYRTLLDVALYKERRGARDWTFTHNHPACGPLSGQDLIIACHLDLAEMRAVCVSGVVWSCQRPAVGWPTAGEMQRLSLEARELAKEVMYYEEESIYSSQGEVSEAEWRQQFSVAFQTSFNALGRGRGLAIHSDPFQGEGAH